MLPMDPAAATRSVAGGSDGFKSRIGSTLKQQKMLTGLYSNGHEKVYYIGHVLVKVEEAGRIRSVPFGITHVVTRDFWWRQRTSLLDQ